MCVCERERDPLRVCLRNQMDNLIARKHGTKAVLFPDYYDSNHKDLLKLTHHLYLTQQIDRIQCYCRIITRNHKNFLKLTKDLIADIEIDR